MAKEIDLIMFPGQAPAALTTAVAAHKKTYEAWVKANTKAKESKTALALATDELAKTQAVYDAELLKWEVK